MFSSPARRRVTLAIATALVLVPACVDMVIDDQRIASPEDNAVVNPPPAERDFAEQNARHRVLLAVIDTGVDYNQPFLSRNMHFTLNAFLRPERLGHDYVGEDGWPAPYVARTSRYDRELGEVERFESQRAFFNAARLVKLFPDMERFFHPSRYVSQEVNAQVDHGTHVAGLMVHDRPDIGLLAYRVLPYNRAPDRSQTASSDYLGEFARMLRAAVADAVADGARVINLSLGIEAGPSDPAMQAVVNVYRRDFARAAASHPRVLFVAAAGNSGTLLDEAEHVSYPCGVRAPNVFCVGALRRDGDPTDFTNIPMSPLDAVFVLGNDVLSTVPVNLCPVDSAGLLDDEHVSDDQLTSLAAAARERCVSSNSLKRKTGTSMASPLVARVAGEILIERPELDAAEVIQEIYRRSTPSDIGGHAVLKLRVPIPSWYLEEQVPEDIPGSGPGGSNALGYWEAYLPAHEVGSP